MKIRDLAFVLIRLLSLYVIVQGIGQFANLFQLFYFQTVTDNTDSRSIALFVVSFVACGLLYFLVGWLLWTRSSRLTRYLVGDAFYAEASHQTPIPLREWYSLGITLVGLVLAAGNIPSLIGYIVQLIQYATSELPSAFATARRQTWISLTVVLLKLIIAFVLIFRADGIMGLIRKIRELGTQEDRQSEA